MTTSRLDSRCSTAWKVATAACMAAIALPSASLASTTPPHRQDGETRTLYGVFRDFRASNVNRGHPDFETTPGQGRSIYTGILADELDEEGMPVMISTGFKLHQQHRDAQGRPIIEAKPYIESRAGDTPGNVSTTPGGAVTSGDSFFSWYRDVPGVNTSAAFPLTLAYDEGRGVYSFDDDLKTQFARVPAFGGNKVYHYTYELETTFVCRKGVGDHIVFGADDCMWVFIDGKLVVDLGGIHDFAEQVVEIDRLAWLEEGQMYTMKILYAERKRVASRYKIETPMELNVAPLPATTGLYD